MSSYGHKLAFVLAVREFVFYFLRVNRGFCTKIAVKHQEHLSCCAKVMERDGKLFIYPQSHVRSAIFEEVSPFRFALWHKRKIALVGWEFFVPESDKTLHKSVLDSAHASARPLS